MDNMSTKKKRGRPLLGAKALGVRFNLRITSELEADLERAAEATGRTPHDFAREVIAASVAQVLGAPP